MIKRLSNNASWSKIISAFHFGIAKLNDLGKIERVVHRVRAVERVKGTANRLFAEAVKAIFLSMVRFLPDGEVGVTCGKEARVANLMRK